MIRREREFSRCKPIAAVTIKKYRRIRIVTKLELIFEAKLPRYVGFTFLISKAYP